MYDLQYPILISRETLEYEIELQADGKVTMTVTRKDGECVNHQMLERFVCGELNGHRNDPG